MNNQSFTEDLAALDPKPKRKLIYQPYILLVLFAIALAILPLFFWGQSISIRLFNTSISFTERHYCRILALFLILGFGVYAMLRKMLWKDYLTWTHVVLTLLIISLLILEGKWVVAPSKSNLPRATLIRVILDNEIRQLRLVSWEGAVFVIGQICFLVNLSVGCMRWQKLK